jgi:hypothetical protein
VQGSFGTKVQSLVASLKALKIQAAASGQPPIQSLVFSQWDAALDVVEAALSRNGIKYLRPQGPQKIGTAVTEFTSNASYEAMLLLFRSGAEGLNITAATHVFLLEPLMDPARERQAIGRVVRMGQTRPTFVHRFVAAGTVEETIVALNQQRQQARDANTAQLRNAYSLTDDDAPIASTANTRQELEQHLHALAAAQLRMATQRRTASDVQEGAPEDNDNEQTIFASGLAREDASVVRMDIIRMFETEEAFAQDITRLGEAYAQQLAAGDSNQVTGSAAATALDASVIAFSAAPAITQGSTAVTAATSADTEEAALSDALALAGRSNHLFWSQLVQHDDRPRRRLQVLTSLSATRSAGADAQPSAAATPTPGLVTVFGRSVHVDVATVLLTLAEPTPAQLAVAADPNMSQHVAAAPAVANYIAGEITRLQTALRT